MTMILVATQVSFFGQAVVICGKTAGGVRSKSRSRSPKDLGRLIRKFSIAPPEPAFV